MFKLFSLFFRLESKNIKFKIVLFALAVYIVGTFVFISNSQYGELEPKTSSEITSLNTALTQFQNVDATDDNVASPLYQNVVSQLRHLGDQSLGIIMNNEDTYIKGAINVSDVQLDAYALENVNDIEVFIPSQREVELKNVLFNNIDKNNEKVFIENDNLPTYITLFIMSISFFWYLLVSISSSDIFLDDTRHPTIVKGYPFSKASIFIAKLLTYLTILGGLLLITYSISIAGGVIFYGNDFRYPVAIFNGQYLTIPLWQYIILSFAYLIIITILALLISSILSYYFKNLYLIIFIQFFLFFFLQIFIFISEYIWFVPFNFLNFYQVLNGSIAETTMNISANVYSGVLLIFMSILLILIFFYFNFYRGDVKNKKGRGEI